MSDAGGINQSTNIDHLTLIALIIIVVEVVKRNRTEKMTNRRRGVKKINANHGIAAAAAAQVVPKRIIGLERGRIAFNM